MVSDSLPEMSKEQMIAENPIMKFFEYDHLPPRLKAVSQACADLAMLMVRTTPRSAELTVGLRKLLEAKDAFVRATLI